MKNNKADLGESDDLNFCHPELEVSEGLSNGRSQKTLMRVVLHRGTCSWVVRPRKGMWQ